MAEVVRINIDHHQLRVVVSFMDLYLSDPPSGEVHNLLHSIVGQQALGLKRKLLLQRLEYRLTMPVHFGLAFRRMVLAALEVLSEGSDLNAMRTLIAAVDPATNRYTHVHA